MEDHFERLMFSCWGKLANCVRVTLEEIDSDTAVINDKISEQLLPATSLTTQFDETNESSGLFFCKYLSIVLVAVITWHACIVLALVFFGLVITFNATYTTAWRLQFTHLFMKGFMLIHIDTSEPSPLKRKFIHTHFLCQRNSQVISSYYFAWLNMRIFSYGCCLVYNSIDTL